MRHDVQLSPAFSDDAQLVIAYALRGRTWGTQRVSESGVLHPGGPGRWRPSVRVSWSGGIRASGLRVLIPGAD